MTRMVSLSDSLYDKIKSTKGSVSFTKFIEELIENKKQVELKKLYEELKERVDKIENFVDSHSNGQY